MENTLPRSQGDRPSDYLRQVYLQQSRSRYVNLNLEVYPFILIMLVVIVLILILLKLWDMWDESSKAECKRIGKKRAREKMQKDQDEKAKEVQRKLKERNDADSKPRAPASEPKKEAEGADSKPGASKPKRFSYEVK